MYLNAAGKLLSDFFILSFYEVLDVSDYCPAADPCSRALAVLGSQISSPLLLLRLMFSRLKYQGFRIHSNVT